MHHTKLTHPHSLSHTHTHPRTLSPASSGDGVYEVVNRILVPFRKPRIPGSSPPAYMPLTQAQQIINKQFAGVRGRVEHVSVSLHVVHAALLRGAPHDASCDVPVPHAVCCVLCSVFCVLCS